MNRDMDKRKKRRFVTRKAGARWLAVLLSLSMAMSFFVLPEISPNIAEASTSISGKVGTAMSGTLNQGPSYATNSSTTWTTFYCNGSVPGLTFKMPTSDGGYATYSGTPTTAGTYSVSIRASGTHATSQSGDPGTQSYTSEYIFTIAAASVAPTITASNVSVTYGSTASIGATVNSGGSLSYSSSSTSIATVTSAGVVTGKGVGTATITITAAANGNYTSGSKQITVTVTQATGSMSVTLQSNWTYTGSAKNLITASSVTGGGTAYYYASTTQSTPAASYAGSTSYPTAVNVGTYYVYYRAAASTNYTAVGWTYKGAVTVSRATPTISASNKSVNVGSTVSIGASVTGGGSLSYSSNATGVATVNASGVITGVSAGTATITISAAASTNYSATSKQITVTVSKATPTITATDKSVQAGSTVSIGATVNSGGALSYSSNNTSVASVDENGVVTGIGAGTATITITAASTSNYNSGTKTITVTVSLITPTITANYDSLTLDYGDTAEVTASVNSGGDISYSSNATGVVTIDENGNVNAVGAGSATITITAAAKGNYASGTKTIAVTVNKIAPTITAEDFVVPYGTSENIGASVNSGGALTYKSGDESIATVDADGKVTSVAIGKTTITITAAATANYTQGTKTINVEVGKTPPAKATITSADSGKNSLVTITWTAPKNNGADIDKYELQRRWGEFDWATISDSIAADATSYTDTTARNGNTYYYRLRAHNEIGWAALWSEEASATPYTTPSKATEFTAQTTGADTVTLSWKAPYNGGSAVTGYEMKVYSDAELTQELETGGTTGRSIVLNEAACTADAAGFEQGMTYYFALRAQNAAGFGATAVAICAWLPGAPVVTGVDSGDKCVKIGQISVNDNGGSHITSYEVYYRAKGTSDWALLDTLYTTSLTDTIKNTSAGLGGTKSLVNGTEYEFYAVSVNTVGKSDASETFSVMAGLPTTPENLAVTTKSGQKLDITFDASDGNGSPILYYNIYADGVKQEVSLTGDKLEQLTMTHYLYSAADKLNGDVVGVYVEAVNKYGTSGKTEVLYCVVGSPSAPELITCETDEAGVSLDWTSSDTNGNRLRTYTVYLCDEEGAVLKKFELTSTADEDTQLRINDVAGGATAGTNEYDFVPGTTYKAYVTCTNTAGEGVKSNVKQFTFGAPSEVLGVTATSGDGTLTVSWTKPANSGLADSVITGYYIYLNDDADPTEKVTWKALDAEGAEIAAEDTETVIASYQLYVTDYRNDVGAVAYGNPQADLESFTVVIGSLANGYAYTASVGAINENGVGPVGGTASTVTPKTNAGAPTDIQAEGVSGTEAFVSWMRPLDSGGGVIKEYKVTPYKVAQKNYDTGKYVDLAERIECTAMTGIIGTSATVKGLEPGYAYEFEVRALSGSSDDDTLIEGTAGTSNRANTYSKPGKPVITSVVSEVGNMTNPKLTVTWKPSSDDGGTPVVGYDVYVNGEYQMNMNNLLSVDNPTAGLDKLKVLDDGTYQYTIYDSRIKKGTTYTINVVAYNDVTRTYNSSTSSYIYKSNDGAWSADKDITAGSIPAPQNVSVVGSRDGTVTISWDMAQYADILNYINAFYVYCDNGTKEITVATVSDGSGTVTVEMQSISKKLSYSVAAVDSQLNVGSKSDPVTLLLGSPNQVEGVKAVPGLRQITTTWDTSNQATLAGNFFVDSYNVYIDGELKANVASDKEAKAIIEGLKGGDTYEVTVAAVNSYGEGPASDPIKVSPWGDPEAPAITNVEPGLGQFTFTMIEGDGNGKIIESHKIFVDDTQVADGDVVYDNTSYVQGSVTNVTVKNVTNTVEHEFYVLAHDSEGYDSAPSAVNKVKTGVPAAPANVRAIAGTAGITVTFDESADISDAYPVKYYQVFRYDTGVYELVGTINRGEDMSCLVSDVKSGKEYMFAVKAWNDFGDSPYSEFASAVAGAPGAPEITEVTPSTSKIALKWSEPSKNAAKITMYAVYVYTKNEKTGEWSGTRALTTAAREAVLSLDNGVKYRLAVSAYNTYGEGTMSEFVEATPGGPPGPVSDVTAEATYGDNGCGIKLTWSAPVDDGGQIITEYKVEGEGTIAVDNAARTATITNLEQGVSYTYTIKALSAAGEGEAYTTDAVTTLDVPSAPKIKGTSSSDNTITVRFAVPSSDGGAEITDYIVEAKLDTQTITWKWSENQDVQPENGIITASISGTTDNELLEGGWYALSVKAVNVVGESAPSDEQEVQVIGGVVETAPSAPTNVKAVSGDGSVTLTWSAPLSDGHSTINQYTVYYSTDKSLLESGNSSGKATTDGHTFTYTFTGLKNGTEIYYAVQAANSAVPLGGAWSDIVSATPQKINAPSAPTWIAFDNTNGVSAYEMNAQKNIMTLKWNASTGEAAGGAIHYEVYVNGRHMNDGETLTDTSYIINFTDDTVANYPEIRSADLYSVIVRAVNEAGGSTDSNYLYTRKTLNVRKSSLAGFTYDEYYADGIYADIDADYDGDVDYKVSYSTPSQPQNVSLRQEANSKAVLLWDAPESNGNKPIKGYYITVGDTTVTYDVSTADSGDVTPSSDGDIMLLSEDGTAETLPAYDYEFAIEYGKAYTAEVKAFNDVGTGSASLASLVTTLIAPTGLGAELPDKTHAKLTWDMASTDVTSYKLYINGKPEEISASNVTLTEGKAEYTREVEVNKDYTFAVSAVYGSGETAKESSLSNTVDVSTHETKANAPTVNEPVADGTTLTITWSAPDNALDAGVDHYVIYVTDINGNKQKYPKQGETSITDTTYTIEVADSCFIEVAGVSALGTEGVLSSPVTYRVDDGTQYSDTAPNPPTDLKVAEIKRENGILADGENLTVTWTTAEALGTSLGAATFEVYVNNKLESTQDAVSGEGANSFTYATEAGKSYVVRVVPINADNESGKAASIKADIPANEYTAPKPIDFNAVLSDDKKSVTLTWTEEADVTYYLTVNGVKQSGTYRSGDTFDLTDGTANYFFVLTAEKTYTDGGTGTADSDEVYINSTGSGTVLSNPPVITGTLSYATSVKVYWNAPTARLDDEQGNIDTYKVVKVLSGGKTEEIGTVTAVDGTTEYIYQIEFDNVSDSMDIAIQAWKTIDGNPIKSATSETWTVTPALNKAADEDKFNNDDGTDKTNPDDDGNGELDTTTAKLPIPVKVNADGVTVKFVQDDRERHSVGLTKDANDKTVAELELTDFNTAGTLNIVISKPGYTSYTLTDVPYEKLSEVNITDAEIFAGDLDGNGKINATDKKLLSDNINSSDVSAERGDLDGNGKINATDKKLLSDNINKQSVTKTWV